MTIDSTHSTGAPAAMVPRRRTWLRWLISAGTALGLVGGIVAILVSLQVLQLLTQDAQARGMWHTLGRRLRARDPQFKNVYENLSSWGNHRPQTATPIERLWNRQYPAVVGTVENDAQLEALRDFVRVVCAEHHYDPELVWMPVRVEPRKEKR